ncbi:ABC transporter permease [Acanthopleuribacter pedis]|uniref:ABC transporter permease n=1 Tax=Acanthopleuribacter pedis TaxID=442870 RepID=A0A8J7QMC8_9BACT|nr:ABC transporter permease [Acanthopleuribacter pedis]MBO1321023.1 ABC transporter permease [Acanthopleuribacter pedis]
MRALLHYWRIHSAVFLGVVIAASILIGALMVGDSVRLSLAQMALARLGQVDAALTPGRFFPVELADRLQKSSGDQARVVAPVVLIPGFARSDKARVSNLQIIGVEEGYEKLFDSDPLPAFPPRQPGFPPVMLNQPLADALQVKVGDDVLFQFANPSEVNREAVLAHKDESQSHGRLRLRVAMIVPDRGAGGFSPRAAQAGIYNAFVPIKRLQRQLERPDQANMLLIRGAAPGGDQLVEDLASQLSLADYGITTRQAEGQVTFESNAFFLPNPVIDRLTRVAAGDNPHFPIFAYLANSIRKGEKVVPYTTVAALDPRVTKPLFTFTAGSGALSENGMWLNQWAADDMGAAVGDTVTMRYYAVQGDGRSEEETATFTVEGVVAMDGLAVDDHLVPVFPGIEDAENIADWNPPFEMDLDAVRPVDETYWDDYRAAPKAFIHPNRARVMWENRFGDATGFRFVSESPGQTRDAVAKELLAGLRPIDGGWVPFMLREAARAGSRGSTDFTGLFTALSFFLIAAALGLVGMLMRLAVAMRSREIGLRLATGFTVTKVRRQFLKEGLLLTAVAALFGVAGAALYGRVIMYGLQHWWALGEVPLEWVFLPQTALIGWFVSVVISLLTIGWSVRALTQTAPVRLLAMRFSASHQGRGTVATVIRALAAVGFAAAAVGIAMEPRAVPAYFGLGSALLFGYLAHLSLRLSRAREGAAFDGWMALSRRNMIRFSGRFLLAVSLVAFACFTLVMTGLSKYHGDYDVNKPEGPAGGFALIGHSDVPLYREASAWRTGSEDEVAAAMRAVGEVVPMRFLPGDDSSCLNLFAPQRPRLLALPDTAWPEGRFTFTATIEPTDQPWRLLDKTFEDGAVPVIGDFNSVQWILKSGLGKDILYPKPGGGEVRLRIVGLVNKSIFQSELIMAESAFLKAFPDESGYRSFYIDPKDDHDTLALANQLEAAYEDYGLDMTTSNDLLQAFHRIENTYISIFQALGGLGLLLGTLGLAVIVLRNAMERRAEFALLRAVGFPQRRIMWMQFGEATLILVQGIAVGAVSATVAAIPQLLKVGLGAQTFEVAGTLVLVFCVGLLATLASVWQTASAPIVAGLKSQ